MSNSVYKQNAYYGGKEDVLQGKPSDPSRFAGYEEDYLEGRIHALEEG